MNISKFAIISKSAVFCLFLFFVILALPTVLSAQEYTEENGVTRFHGDSDEPIVFTAAPIRGPVLFDTFGPGDSYNTGSGWTLGYDFELQRALSFSFSDGLSYFLESISVAIAQVSGTNNLTIRLMDDSGGEPGATIETWNLSGEMGAFGTANPPIVINSVVLPILDSDTTYWIVASVPAGDWSAWNRSEPQVDGTVAGREGEAGAWTVQNSYLGAFRVTGNQTPVELQSFVVE